MKEKFLSHIQLVMFSYLAPATLILFELIPLILFPIKKDLFAFILFTIQYMVVWLILFVIYNYAYQTIYLDEETITNGKNKIHWENIQRYEIEGIELLQYSIIPTIYLDSMVFFIGNDGKRIGFSMRQKNIKKLSYYADKNPVISEFVTKYKKQEHLK